jgi:hypothetical protein
MPESAEQRRFRRTDAEPATGRDPGQHCQIQWSYMGIPVSSPLPGLKYAQTVRLIVSPVPVPSPAWMTQEKSPKKRKGTEVQIPVNRRDLAALSQPINQRSVPSPGMYRKFMPEEWSPSQTFIQMIVNDLCRNEVRVDQNPAGTELKRNAHKAENQRVTEFWSSRPVLPEYHDQNKAVLENA